MESSIDMPLRQFAETTETYSKYLKDMVSVCGGEAVVDRLRVLIDQHGGYPVSQ